MSFEERVIGRYRGHQDGPLFIVIAAMHGNEPAGVEALETVFQMLKKEEEKNLNFTYSGNLIGLIGNLRAYKKGCRFIRKDMNRQWLKENIDHCLQADSASMAEEDNELKELFSTIQEEIEKTKPSRIVLLDLHTTSARGGIFSIATDHPESVRIAIELHAPVILGMLRGIDGTTLHYFVSENFGIPVTAIAFEAGHHRNPLSVNRSISAIINCMRTIGSVKREDVEHHHDEILIQYSKGLPRLAELILVHKIEEDDEFRMNPGFLNFQSVVKGQELACDRHGPITAPDNGLILMPLYQKEGKEGFFIVKKKA